MLLLLEPAGEPVPVARMVPTPVPRVPVPMRGSTEPMVRAVALAVAGLMVM